MRLARAFHTNVFVFLKAFAGITGAVLIGIALLMLAYMIKAALTDLSALGPEA